MWIQLTLALLQVMHFMPREPFVTIPQELEGGLAQITFWLTSKKGRSSSLLSETECNNKKMLAIAHCTNSLKTSAHTCTFV